MRTTHLAHEQISGNIDPSINPSEPTRINSQETVQNRTTIPNSAPVYTELRRTQKNTLRKLLRRFSNQLSHGCTNARCNVPTCLSYRKRTSHGVVRAYTEATLRAYALYCVERLGQQCDDDDITLILRGKQPRHRHASSSSHQAPLLCWSTPVVPWYADPGEHATKLRRASQTSAETRKQNSTQEPPCSLAPPPTQSFHKLSDPKSKGSPRVGGDTHHIEVNSYRSSQSFGDLPPTLMPIQSQKIDSASISQFLYNHPRLRQLEYPSDSAHDDNITAEDVAEARDDYKTERSCDRQDVSASPLLSQPESRSLRNICKVEIPSTRTALGFNHGRSLDFIRQLSRQTTTDPVGALAFLTDFIGDWPHEKLDNNVEPFAEHIDLPPARRPDYPRLAPVLRRELAVGYFIPDMPLFQDMHPPLQSSGRPYLINDLLARLIYLYIEMARSSCSRANLPPTLNPSSSYLKSEPRNSGRVMFRTASDTTQSQSKSLTEELNDFMEKQFWIQDTQFVQLFVVIADIINHRAVVELMTIANPKTGSQGVNESEGTFLQALMSVLTLRSAQGRVYDAARGVIDAMQAVIICKWNRRPLIETSDPCAAALNVLEAIWNILEKDTRVFVQMPFTNICFRDTVVAHDYLKFEPGQGFLHILDYGFLFEESQLTRIFRCIQLQRMHVAVEKVRCTHTNAKSSIMKQPWTVRGAAEIFSYLRPMMTRAFVLTVRRTHVLEDAIGQVWRRERQEMSLPLKVRLGEDEGEEGSDYGGVQQELFRLIFAMAFDPAYGMFDVDYATRMAWFKPGTLEPLYKFEVLGILMGLAIYNGITLPLTMPLAFYRRIVGLKGSGLNQIEDGWPELYKSFKWMLDYSEGDVKDVLARTYEFSYDHFGTTVNVDMLSPFRAPDEPVLAVNNANRAQFVEDYIRYLTDVSIRPQLEAFLHGLHALVPARAFRVFHYHPELLQSVIEGTPSATPIDIDALRKVTTYSDYDPTASTITSFWHVLKVDLTQPQLRKFLEFVTASDRIPVNGYAGIGLCIQRNGHVPHPAEGEDGGGSMTQDEVDKRLPGASTCYARLLLPEYSTQEVLKERLLKAIEEGVGFGML